MPCPNPFKIRALTALIMSYPKNITRYSSVHIHSSVHVYAAMWQFGFGFGYGFACVYKSVHRAKLFMNHTDDDDNFTKM